jgi:NAD(P)-dependent dehydrogenase (short-subunit alcohol dehydrogenase family)
MTDASAGHGTTSSGSIPTAHPRGIQSVDRFFDGQVAVVTGAGSGIGRAIALSLWSRGAHVCLLGRTQGKLEETARMVGDDPTRLTLWPVDLTSEEGITFIKGRLLTTCGRLDMLIHCAGVIHTGAVETASPRDFETQYRANVLAPFCLTQALLPLLKAAAGQIVFVNSSVGLTAPRDVSQFAATQFGLKAFADSLRAEVNPFGIRVLSVHPGRTATPRQAQLYAMRHQEYKPELLLQPEDVASIVLSALSLPRTAEVTDLAMRPLLKSY